MRTLLYHICLEKKNLVLQFLKDLCVTLCSDFQETKSVIRFQNEVKHFSLNSPKSKQSLLCNWLLVRCVTVGCVFAEIPPSYVEGQRPAPMTTSDHFKRDGS